MLEADNAARERSARLKKLDEYHRTLYGELQEKKDGRDRTARKRKRQSRERSIEAALPLQEEEEWHGLEDSVEDGLENSLPVKSGPVVQVFQDPALKRRVDDSRAYGQGGSARNFLSSKVSAVESTRRSANGQGERDKEAPRTQEDGDEQERANDAELKELLSKNGLLKEGRFDPSQAIKSLLKESTKGKERHKVDAREMALLSGKAPDSLLKQNNVPQAIALGMTKKRLARHRTEVAKRAEEELSRAPKKSRRNRGANTGTKNLTDFKAYEEAEANRERSTVKGMSLSAPRHLNKRDRGIGHRNGKFKDGVLTLRPEALARVRGR